MPHFIDPQSRLHFVEDAYSYMLPSGCIAIADAEAEAIRSASIPAPAKEQLIAAIDKQRDDALTAGFTYNGHLYHCDPTFQAQVTSYITGFAVGLIPPAASVPIRRKDNTSTTMTQAELLPFSGALMQHVQSIYAASWAAKDALP